MAENKGDQRRPDGRRVLTSRQRDVLRLLAEGKTNSQIGEALGISLDGAKWHVSELLSRLGVSSREEAAEHWRRELSLQRRASGLRRMVAPSSLLARVSTATVILIAATGAALALAAIVWGHSSVETTDTPDGESLPVPPTEAARVQFKLCATTKGWQKPPPDTMTAVFEDRRFGDGARPSPWNWTLYEADFYWIGEPRSSSLNKEVTAFSGAERRDPALTEHYCDYSTDFPPSSLFEALWLVDHKVTAMYRVGGALTVETAPDPRTFQEVAFPYPPEPGPLRPGQTKLLVDSIRVVNSQGALLYERGHGWEAEYDDSGRMLYGKASGSGTVTGVIRTSSPLALDAIGNGPLPAGTILVFDDQGRETARYRIPAGGKPWSVAASVLVQPGASTIRLEFSGSGFAFTMLPSSAERTRP